MNSASPRPLLNLAFDVDGVLLDYSGAYADTMRRFGVEPVARGELYHCTAKFGFDPSALPAEEKARFYDLFDRHGWRDMPSLPGAVEALAALAEAGHGIRYLTSMPAARSEDRIGNLRARGFPEGPLVATGHRRFPADTPKAAHLDAWRPDWFVDDWAHNFKGVAAGLPTRFALILGAAPDHPNLAEDAADRALAHVEFARVDEFAERILDGSLARPL